MQPQDWPMWLKVVAGGVSVCLFLLAPKSRNSWPWLLAILGYMVGFYFVVLK